MISQVIFFEVSIANGFNVFLYFDNNFRNPEIGYRVIGILFLFGTLSIFTNTAGAVYLLIRRKHIFIVILSLLAVVMYSYHALQTMKEF
jgi:hypothetical protein